MSKKLWNKRLAGKRLKFQTCVTLDLQILWFNLKTLGISLKKNSTFSIVSIHWNDENHSEFRLFSPIVFFFYLNITHNGISEYFICWESLCMNKLKKKFNNLLKVFPYEMPISFHTLFRHNFWVYFFRWLFFEKEKKVHVTCASKHLSSHLQISGFCGFWKVSIFFFFFWWALKYITTKTNETKNWCVIVSS